MLKTKSRKQNKTAKHQMSLFSVFTLSSNDEYRYSLTISTARVYTSNTRPLFSYSLHMAWLTSIRVQPKLMFREKNQKKLRNLLNLKTVRRLAGSPFTQGIQPMPCQPWPGGCCTVLDLYITHTHALFGFWSYGTKALGDVFHESKQWITFVELDITTFEKRQPTEVPACWEKMKLSWVFSKWFISVLGCTIRHKSDAKMQKTFLCKLSLTWAWQLSSLSFQQVCLCAS